MTRSVREHVQTVRKENQATSFDGDKSTPFPNNLLVPAGGALVID